MTVLKNRILLCFSFGIFFLSSCEKDIDLNLKGTEQLCFNCVLNPDSLITAKLTLSRSISDNTAFQTIDNALIELKEDGMFMSILQNEGDGIYIYNGKPRAGAVYEVSIQAVGYPRLTASTRVPEKPVIACHLVDSVLHTTEYATSSYSYYTYRALKKIYDQTGVNRYWHYRKNFIRGSWHFRSDFDEVNSPLVDDFNRQTDSEEKYGFYYFGYIRICDTGFDGEVLSFYSGARREEINYFMDSDEHYDKYLKSVLKQQINDNTDIRMNEPLQIYSNINSGFGIFGAIAVSQVEW